jgi:hypothetical protein
LADDAFRFGVQVSLPASRRNPGVKFETYVVAFPINRDECKLGKELLCKICKTYCYNGLGFNIQHGGISNVAPKLEELSEATARAKWDGRLMLRNESLVFEKQVVDDIEKYEPQWEIYCGYLSRGDEAYRQDLIGRVDEKVAKIKDDNWGREEVRAGLEKVKKHNRLEEAEVEDESGRAGLATIHRRAEEKIMAELDALRGTPTPSE